MPGTPYAVLKYWLEKYMLFCHPVLVFVCLVEGLLALFLVSIFAP